MKTGPTWMRWRIVALLMAFSYVSWFLRVSISVAYDEKIEKELHIKPGAMGYVYSGFLLAYMLCMTPGGWLIDRRGTRAALTLMGFGLTLFGALTGLVGASDRLLGQLPATVTAVGITLATPLLLFLVVRSLMGIFAAPMYPASAQAIAHWLPFPRRGWANGLVQGSALLGIASTPLAVGTLLVWLDWPQTFLVLAVGTGLLTIVWAQTAADRPEQHPAVNSAERDLIAAGSPPAVPPPSAGRGGVLLLLRNRSLVYLTLSYAAVGYFEYLFFFWMNHYFKKELNLPPEVRYVYDAVPYLAMGAGMAFGGVASDALVRAFGYRRGRVLVPVIGLLVGAVFLLLGVIVKWEPAVIVVCFSVALGAVGMVEAPTWTTAQELGGRRGGTAAGICNTGGNAGGLVAPILTPLVADRLGWPVAIGLAGAVCLAGVMLWTRVDPRERIAEG